MYRNMVFAIYFVFWAAVTRPLVNKLRSVLALSGLWVLALSGFLVVILLLLALTLGDPFSADHLAGHWFRYVYAPLLLLSSSIGGDCTRHHIRRLLGKTEQVKQA